MSGDLVTIDRDGRYTDPTMASDQDAQSAADFSDAIDEARQQASQNADGGSEQPPAEEETAYVVVQPGDSLWSIAERAGVDPSELSYGYNQQFADPDLIHPGEIVFVKGGDLVTASSSDTPSNFDEAVQSINGQLSLHGPFAEGSPEANDEHVLGAIVEYLESLPEDQRAAVAEVLAQHDWGSQAANDRVDEQLDKARDQLGISAT
ncbi:LysM peptidoglycan-binding domain-containing protein [Kaustia mangrovi]|uniref:LysM peptidoglycan-binding domain-containing protein n=1 Tax=Kaustia mangrovi TaxID=2593653 RepID=A0A7S8C6M8_9HYPH|nr:LysM peptidoglycan-binding domain-containing protein [Kaustia mangrovi]QPC44388.1 LysM peptidoglycan-binding domain-containing protein [Kaustia mangrovi]